MTMNYYLFSLNKIIANKYNKKSTKMIFSVKI